MKRKTSVPLVLVGLGLLALLVPCGLTAAFVAFSPDLLPPGHAQRTNAAAAGERLRELVEAQEKFLHRDSDGDEVPDYGTFAELAAAELLDEELATGTRHGYVFEAQPSVTSPQELWMAVAAPAEPGVSGDRYFAVTNEGTVYYRRDKPFQLNDPCLIPPGAIEVRW